MKFLVNIVLFLFVAFLVTPTVVSVIQEEADVSVVYSFTEEELQKEVKEVKAGPQYEFALALFSNPVKADVIKSANRTKHDNVNGEICSPPPETI